MQIWATREKVHLLHNPVEDTVGTIFHRIPRVICWMKTVHQMEGCYRGKSPCVGEKPEEPEGISFTVDESRENSLFK